LARIFGIQFSPLIIFALDEWSKETENDWDTWDLARTSAYARARSKLKMFIFSLSQNVITRPCQVERLVRENANLSLNESWTIPSSAWYIVSLRERDSFQSSIQLIHSLYSMSDSPVKETSVSLKRHLTSVSLQLKCMTKMHNHVIN